MKTPVLLLLAATVLAGAALLPKFSDSVSENPAPMSKTEVLAPAIPTIAAPEPSESAQPEPVESQAEAPAEEIETTETNEPDPVIQAKPALPKSPEFRKRMEAITSRYSVGLQDIVRLVQGKIDQEVILAYIRSSRVPFAPTSQQVVQLHQLGVSSELIKAIIDRGVELRAQQAEAYKKQQEQYVLERQLAVQAAQAAYAAAQNRNSSIIPGGAPPTQGPAYNNGLGSGAYNNNYTVFPTYTYAVLPQTRGHYVHPQGQVQNPPGSGGNQQPTYNPPAPKSTFKYADKFRYALPNSSYRSPEGYTAPLPENLRDRLK